AGNVYIADSLNSRVRRVTPTGTISTVAGNGTAGLGGDGGAATSAQINSPTGVAVDAAGNLYIADFANNRVRQVTAGGTISAIGGTDWILPSSVAADAAGNAYVGDSGNNRIRLINASGGVSTIAGNGLAGFSGDGGSALKAQVGNPVGLALDNAGNL